MARRSLAGWRHGPVRDNALLLHPDMKPYAELDEDAKRKDREQVALVPVQLSRGGEALTRLDPFALLSAAGAQRAVALLAARLGQRSAFAADRGGGAGNPRRDLDRGGGIRRAAACRGIRRRRPGASRLPIRISGAGPPQFCARRGVSRSCAAELRSRHLPQSIRCSSMPKGGCMRRFWLEGLAVLLALAAALSPLRAEDMRAAVPLRPQQKAVFNEIAQQLGQDRSFALVIGISDFDRLPRLQRRPAGSRPHRDDLRHARLPGRTRRRRRQADQERAEGQDRRFPEQARRPRRQPADHLRRHAWLCRKRPPRPRLPCRFRYGAAGQRRFRGFGLFGARAFRGADGDCRAACLPVLQCLLLRRDAAGSGARRGKAFGDETIVVEGAVAGGGGLDARASGPQRPARADGRQRQPDRTGRQQSLFPGDRRRARRRGRCRWRRAGAGQRTGAVRARPGGARDASQGQGQRCGLRGAAEARGAAPSRAPMRRRRSTIRCRAILSSCRRRGRGILPPKAATSWPKSWRRERSACRPGSSSNAPTVR